MKELRLAAVGLDTSHTIEFTRFFQGDCAPGERVEGVRVVSCLRFPSPFQTEDQQDERQAVLEGWGVRVTRQLDEALAEADGVLLTINDPALHWEYFAAVAERDLPVFIDKPLAGSVADGENIVRLVRERGLVAWSSSSLRFLPSLEAACAAVPDVTMCHVMGPLGEAPAGSSVVWYGVHAVEMLVRALGMGVRRVAAVADDGGVVALCDFAGGRRGVVQLNRGLYHYLGSVHGKGSYRVFDGEDASYRYQLLRVRDFFRSGNVPVVIEEALEVLRILEAIDRSLASGGGWAVLPGSDDGA